MTQNDIQKTTKDEIKLLKPKTDIIFQSLFSSNHRETTKAFAQALLGEKIDKMTINEGKTLLREKINDKLGILDLELDINNCEKVDVEIQLVDKKNFVERLLFYFSKLYQSQIKKGSNYLDAKRVVLIAIIDYPFELTKEIEEMETIWQIFEKNHPNLKLTNYLEIHILELEKVRKTYPNNKNDEKAQWLMFIDDPNSKEVKDIMKENEEIKEATIIVRKMSEDEEMQRIADLREKAIMDEKAIFAAGLDKGIAQGIEQMKVDIEQAKIEMNKAKDEAEKSKNEMEKAKTKMKQTIKKLYKNNMSISQIATIVDIDEKEIKKILDN